MVNCPHACGGLIRQLFMGFKSPLENWNVWQKKSRTAEESLIFREIVEWVAVFRLANIFILGILSKYGGFIPKTSKLRLYSFILAIENFDRNIEWLSETWHFDFFLISVEECREVEWFCLLWGSICNSWTKNGLLIATRSITIFSLRPFEDNL